MATKDDFTEEEWETLQKGVTGAGFWMTIADRGFFDTFKESSAMAKHLAGARQNSESTLVRDLGDTKGTGFGWRSSPEEIAGETIAALQDAQQILETQGAGRAPGVSRVRARGGGVGRQGRRGRRGRRGGDARADQSRARRLAAQADRVQVVLDDLACAPCEVVDVVVLGVEVTAGERVEPP